MRTKKIKLVDVNLDAFADKKNVADLKKEEGRIFDHLSKDDADAAYAELWDAINPKKADTQPATTE
jgi:hypothetical protein